MYEFGQIFSQIKTHSTGVVAIVVLVLEIIVVVSILAGHGSWRHKLIWTVVVLLLPVIGVILYFVFGRSSRDRPLIE